jgi:signal transduction histidine kinase/tetratricopeptide (TPR) repeat protein
MANRRPQRKPVFFWQAALILLPVAVLAVVGFVFLRQDRLLARREAADRAQAIADDLLPRVLNLIVTTNVLTPDGGWPLKIDSRGRLVFPPPVPPPPEARTLDVAALNAQQADLWQKAQAYEASGNGDAAVPFYRDFISSNPPDDFCAAAHYALGLLLLKHAPSDPDPSRNNAAAAADAAAEFNQILEKYPTAVGESGLSFRTLAEMKLFGLFPPNPTSVEAAPAPTDSILTRPLVNLQTIASNAVCFPTFLTPYVLQALSQIVDRVLADPALDPQKVQALRQQPPFDIKSWTTLWNDHEISRELFRGASSHLTNNSSAFWFQSDLGSSNQFFPQVQSADGRWLAVPLGMNPNTNSNGTGANYPEVLTPLASLIDPAVGNVSEILASAGTRFAATNASTFWIACYHESVLRNKLQAVFDEKKIPDYLDVGFEMAGRRLLKPFTDVHLWHWVGYIGRRGGGVKKEPLPELATEILASAAHPANGADLVRINVYLTSPADLFRRQHARTFWFGSVIGASSLTAFIGLLAAWRAFGRQEQLAEMKTNFVSSVSHELRAPIASVRLLAESLERGNVSDLAKQNQYYHFIGQECRRLSSLIENVLDFSRIEQGRKRYQFEPTDLLALVRQSVALMESYTAEKEVSLGLKLSPGIAIDQQFEVLLDGQAIQQALINLVDNALKHSAPGQTITVGLELSEQLIGGQTQESAGAGVDSPAVASVALYVEDGGPGIPAEEHQKIFERFYRLGSELRRETQGIGIGLSIVKHIVEAHDGKVVVRSEPGKGSRFTIVLPIKATNIEGEPAPP